MTSIFQQANEFSFLISDLASKMGRTKINKSTLLKFSYPEKSTIIGPIFYPFFTLLPSQNRKGRKFFWLHQNGVFFSATSSKKRHHLENVLPFLFRQGFSSVKLEDGQNFCSLHRIFELFAN